MNVNLYGCRGQWLMVDLGLTFADPDYPGIDLILPDLEFIEKQQDRLVGIVLTHGHEDHIGALPYLAADLKVPLYATPFTAGLIAGKLEEEGLTGQVKLNIVERGGSDRARPVQGQLRRARPLDSRGQWPADRNAVRQHLPHRRLEDRRDAGARRAVEHRSADRDRRRGRAGAGLRFDQRLPGRGLGLRGRASTTGCSTQVAKARGPGAGHHLRVERRAAADDRPGRDRDRPPGVRRRPLARPHPARSPGDRLSADFPEPIRFDEAMRLPRERGADHRHRRAGRAARRARPDRLRAATSSSWPRATRSSSRRRIIPGNEIAIGRIMNALSDLGVLIVTERQAHVHVSGHPGPARAGRDVRLGPAADPRPGPRRGAAPAPSRRASRLATAFPRRSSRRMATSSASRPAGPKKLGEVRVGRLVLDGDVILPADGTTHQRAAQDRASTG